MLVGFLAGYFKILNAGSSEALSSFVFVVSLPALIFISLSRVPVQDFFNWSFLGALGGGMLITFCLSLVVARFVFPGSLTALALHGLSAMFSSTAYIGLPLVLIVFGDAALVPGIIGAVITGVVFLSLGIILAEVDKSRSKEGGLTLSPLLAILKHPTLLATTAGLTVSAIGIVVPTPIATFCELLGGAFIPCALFAAGLFIANCSFRGQSAEIGWLVFAKLLVHPLVTWWLAYRVFALDGMLAAIAVLRAALPTGVPVFVLAQRYGIFVTRSSAVILVSTTLSVLTLSALIVYLVGTTRG